MRLVRTGIIREGNRCGGIIKQEQRYHKRWFFSASHRVGGWWIIPEWNEELRVGFRRFRRPKAFWRDISRFRWCIIQWNDWEKECFWLYLCFFFFSAFIPKVPQRGNCHSLAYAAFWKFLSVSIIQQWNGASSAVSAGFFFVLMPEKRKEAPSGFFRISLRWMLRPVCIDKRP